MNSSDNSGNSGSFLLIISNDLQESLELLISIIPYYSQLNEKLLDEIR